MISCIRRFVSVTDSIFLWEYIIVDSDALGASETSVNETMKSMHR